MSKPTVEELAAALTKIIASYPVRFMGSSGLGVSVDRYGGGSHTRVGDKMVSVSEIQREAVEEAENLLKRMQ